MDEVFGLIETVEKTAQLYMLTLDKAINFIPDSVLKELVEFFKLTPMEGILD
jgi:rhamnulose-1-phosphate aldolase